MRPRDHRQGYAPCLYYDIKLCSGPCIGAIDQAGYRQSMLDLCSFLEGRTEEIVERFRAEMEKASHNLAFERAAACGIRFKPSKRWLRNRRSYPATWWIRM